MGTGIALKIRGLSKSYGVRRVLRALDLEVPAGEFLAIVGRSGCGESTLLRVIAGLDAPDTGKLSFDDETGAGACAEVRMIFQETRLLPWITVLSNVSLGARPATRARSHARQTQSRARSLLDDVGLADRAREWPGRLSGGQRQRVTLARGLMSEPRLLLLDEPLGALDALTRPEMQQLIGRLWRASGFTSVLVTHDIHEAVALADRVIVLEEGALVADVAPSKDPEREGPCPARSVIRAVKKSIRDVDAYVGANPHEVATLLAPKIGMQVDAIEDSLGRTTFDLHAVGPDLVASQQRVADTFFSLGIIPHSIKVADAVVQIAN